jgi:hypothetical protein
MTPGNQKKPLTGQRRAAGSMRVSRAGQGAVLLENGNALVAGGATSTGVTATTSFTIPPGDLYGNPQHERCARALAIDPPAERRLLLTRLAGGDSCVAVCRFQLAVAFAVNLALTPVSTPSA